MRFKSPEGLTQTLVFQKKLSQTSLMTAPLLPGITRGRVLPPKTGFAAQVNRPISLQGESYDEVPGVVSGR
jgi:hypothetical protein